MPASRLGPVSHAETAASTVALSHGVAIPSLGLGTWRMSDAEAERAVARAVEEGYRLLDTAALYNNEAGVGRGIRSGGIPRDELFVTTKLAGSDHGGGRARRAYEHSLERLGLDYADLYLIHWPVPAQNRYIEAWEALVALQREGRVRAIGVSNFKPAHIERLVRETGVAPQVNQIELDPTRQRALARACHAAHGIATQSWAPLGGAASGALLSHPVILELAARHDRTPAQVVLRWHLEQGLIAIPKSTHVERMRENIDLWTFSLGPADLDRIAALDDGEAAVSDSDLIGY